MLSLRGTAADGSPSRRPGRATEGRIPHALSNGQLVAYYQPEVELSSGRVVAAESLARWEHPEFGTLPPAMFISVADQLGLMGELTRLMLRLSLVQHRVWAAAGRPCRPVAAPGHRSGGRADAGRRRGHHGGLRAVAGLSLGPPASGPDRGPGVFPAERGRRILRLAGVPPHRPLVIFAYPIGDLLLLFGVLSLLWRGVPQASVTPSPDPGPGAAAGPATAVPPAWAERQVPNGRIGGPDVR